MEKIGKKKMGLTDEELMAKVNSGKQKKGLSDEELLAKVNARKAPTSIAAAPSVEPYEPVKLKDDPRLHDPKLQDQIRGYSSGDLFIDKVKKGLAETLNIGPTIEGAAPQINKAIEKSNIPGISQEAKINGLISDFIKKKFPQKEQEEQDKIQNVLTPYLTKILGIKGYQPDPTSTKENAIGGAGDFIGQNIVLSPASLTKSLAKGGLKKLGIDLGTETLSSAGGGAGFAAGEKWGAEKDKESKNKTPFWQLIGGAGGGITGGGLTEILASQAIPKGISAIKNQVKPVLTGENAANAIKQSTTKDLRGALSADPESLKRLQESLDLSKEIKEKHGEDFNPDLAQATGSKSVEDLKKRLDLGSAESVSKDMNLQKSNTSALERILNKVFPETQTRKTAEANFDNDMKEIADKKAKLAAEQEQLSNEIQNHGFNKAKGERVRQIGEEQFNTAYQNSEKLYAALDNEARQAGFKLDSQPLMSLIKITKENSANLFQESQVNAALGEIEKILQKNSKPAEKGGEISILNKDGIHVLANKAKVPAKAPELNWDEYRSMLKHLNNAYMGTKNVYTRQFLDQFKQSAKAQAEAVAPNLTAKLDSVNGLFGDMKDTFLHGAYGEMKAEGAYGYKTSGSQIIQRNFLSKGEEGADRFIETFGSHPEANELMRDAIIDDFARSSLKDGVFDPVKARSYLARDDVKGFLSKFPDLKKELSGKESAGQALLDRAAALTEEANQKGKSALAELAKNPDTKGALKKMAKDYNQTEELVKQVKTNPELGHGVMREYANIAWDDPKFLLENEGNLKPIFDAMGKDHWENIKTLAKGREITSRTSATPLYRADTEVDPALRLTGTSMSGWFSRIRGSAMRMTSPAYAVFDLGGKYAFKVAQDDAKKMMEAAFYDPKLAEDLAKAEYNVHLPDFSNYAAKDFISDIKERLKLHGIRIELNTAKSAISDTNQKEVDAKVKNSDARRKAALENINKPSLKALQ